MSGALNVTVIVVDWPTGIDEREVVTLKLVVSGTTPSVPLIRVTV